MRAVAHAFCMKERFRRLAARVRRAVSVLAQHRVTTIAGALVFFLALSIAPFVFWLTLLFGKTASAGEALLTLAPYEWAQELASSLRENAEAASEGAGILFLLTTLWSSTSFFYHLRKSGEILYGYRRTARGWRVRLSALAVTLGVLLFFAGAGCVAFAGAVAVRVLPPVLGYPALFALLFLLGFFAAWILNAYVCPFRTRPAETIPGSLVTAALWLAASLAFAVYLRFSSGGKLYGALALVTVLLLFLYWMMICFTAGAVFNRCRLRRSAARKGG